MGLNPVAFVLLIIAAVLGALAGALRPHATWLVGWAIAALSVALIFEFGAHSHSVTLG